MLIIGLLAAIAIPSFFNQRDKANDADAKEQVTTAKTAAETYATEQTGGDYVGLDTADLTRIEPVLTDVPAADLAAAPSASGDGYTVSVDAADTGTTFSIQRTDTGQLNYTCNAGGTGGCPTGGSWE
ncbi:MAG: hypothetical protein H0W09_07030 [Solirubrobacterales bacterium]|nr:hypothetical protein [Solirubrobacterales bacterium]